MMKYVILTVFVSMICRGGLGFSATSLTDDTVLATLPKARIQGLSAEEAMHSLQRKAGIVDPALAVSLAVKNVQMGAMTDDVRRYGSALAVLESVPAGQRASLEYQRTLADVQSLLHQFDLARSTLNAVLTKDPKDDVSRRKLFYLELLRGEINHAKKHCDSTSGFSDATDGVLCAYHASLAAGRLLPLTEEARVAKVQKNGSVERRLWAADILLDQRFLQCVKGHQDGCTSFKNYTGLYVKMIDGEKTRLAYAADRLMMAGFFDDAIATLPESTKNLALATRRLALLSKLKDSSQWTDSDRELQKTILGALISESDRGQVEHAREAAIVAFFVEKNPSKGKVLATMNWETQREWIDLWLMQMALTSSADSAVSSAIGKWSKSQDAVTPFGGLP